MGWNEAVVFAKHSLNKVLWSVPGLPHSAKFFDLNVVPEEVWVGRFEFDESMAFNERWNADSWNCFACTLPQIREQQKKITSDLKAALADQMLADIVPTSCVVLNASRLVRDFKTRMYQVGLWSD